MTRHAAQHARLRPRRVGSTVFHALRRLGQTRPARAVLTRPRVERVIAVGLQSTTVRGAPRFVIRELSGRGAHARYELRSSRRPIYLRHNTADPLVLDEVFYSGHYELPGPVAAHLDGLGRAPEIVDLGANIGLFGVLMLERFPGARIVAFEPDRTNADIHRRTLAANGGAGSWELLEAAASNRDGRVSFRSGEYSRSRIEEGAGEEVDAIDVFPYLERADFAKIDIEGGEWAILGDARFASLPTPVLALEYHADLSPNDDPRGAAFARLEEAGYRTVGTWELAEQGMLWAWKPEVERAEPGEPRP